MAGERAKGGKKNRKHSRQKNKPCQKRYTGEGRWLKNKAKNIAREEHRKALRAARNERRARRAANRMQKAA